MANQVSKQALERLAKYWFRANLMREYVHAIVEDTPLENLSSDDWWEFETYLSYWLSGLFIVVEGFNKLKLKDARVQKQFKAHLRDLKMMRHETYHFTLDVRLGGEVLLQLNWAEELHDAIGDFLKEIIGRKAQVERFMERRAKTKRK